MFGGSGRKLDDQLNKIIRSAKTDPGSPFEKENIEFLCTIRTKKPAEWQRARAEFRKSRILVSALEAEMDKVIKARIRIVKPEEKVDDTTRERHELTAQSIIESGDVLKLFAEEYAHLIAGEEKIGKLLYLVGTSRLFRKPMSAVVKGVSSGGKSELREHCLRFFPETEVIHFTSFSARALVFDPRDFRNKILSMGEASGMEDVSLQDYFIRELISGGHLHYAMPAKGESGQIEGQVIHKEGPVSFLITTTRNSLHKENETRLISMEIDDSSEQTAKVIERVMLAEGMGELGQEINFEKWHAFQYWLGLGPREVTIPWARHLGKMIPPKAVRLRRDSGQIVRAVKAHALINQAHRKVDERGRVVADIEKDYLPVYELLADMVAQGVEAKTSDVIIDTCLKVGALQNDDDPKHGVTAKAVSLVLKCDPTSAQRRLRKAEALGLVENLEGRPRHPGRYRCTDQVADNNGIMPAWDDLQESWDSRPA